MKFRAAVALCAVLAAPSLGLLIFSQTVAWYPDEGFHLVAAQLINAGKRPYVDFFYQHPPLFAYITAGWMRLFGDSWRSAHLLSTMLAVASIVLVTRFVATRVRDPRWRLATASCPPLFIGFHLLVIRFGTIGQPYGLCLFLVVASFCVVIEAVHRERALLSAGGGLCAGAAAASSLLAAPASPLLLLWIFRHNQAGNRLGKAIGFVAGATIPFLPLLWLAAQAPRYVLFDVVEFHAFYRATQLDALSLTFHNLRVLTAWLSSAQALVLVLLSVIGLLLLINRYELDHRCRAEFSLCAWLTIGLGMFSVVASPMFPQYFLLLIPFLGILASLGVYAIGSRIGATGRPAWVVLGLVALFAAGLMKSAYAERKLWVPFWPGVVEVAREINRVTPRNGTLYAPHESVYFATRRLPPPGLENLHAVEAQLPPGLAATRRIAPQSRVDEWLASGRFDTIVIGVDDPRLSWLGLPRLYGANERLGDWYLFWGRRPPVESSQET